jgi:hypothetical protein
MQITKKLTTLLAVLLVGFTATPANATDTPLTDVQFLQSQSYRDYMDIAHHSDELWAADPGTTIHATVDVQLLVSMRALDFTINATKDGSRTTVTSQDQEPSIFNYFGGKYYNPIENACKDFYVVVTLDNPCVAQDYLGKIKNNLANTNAKYVSSTTSPLQSGTIDTTPDSINQGNFSNPMYILETWLGNDDLSFASYSELTSSPNPSNGTQTDYKFSIHKGMPDSAMTTDIDVTQTVSAEGKIVSTVVTETAKTTFVTMGVTATVTQEAWATPDLVAPNPSEVITQTTFNKAANKTMADLKVLETGNNIVTKAKALAKKAKRTLDSTQLVNAAKALKVKYANIKNGIKISYKYSGATSYACITVVKGKAITKTC